jgi:hypothetical protein
VALTLGVPLAEGADESGALDQVAVPLRGGRREVARLLERRGDDGRLAEAHRLALELLAEFDQQGLRRPAQRGGRARG